MRARLTLWFPRVGFGALVASLLLTPTVFTRTTAEAFEVPKVTILWFCLLVAVLGAGTWAMAARRSPLPRSPLVWPLLVLLGWTVLATVLSPSPVLSVFGHYARYDGLLGLVAGIVTVAVVVAYTWRDPSRLRWLVYAIVIGGLVDMAYVALQYAGLDWIHWVDVAGKGITRPYGLLGNSNFSGAHLAIVIPAAIALRSQFVGRWIRWGLVACAAVLAVGVWWTGTRGGALAVVGGIAALGVLTPELVDTRIRWGAIALTGVAIVLIVVSASESVPGAVTAGRPKFFQATGLTDRQDIWSASLAMTRDHPLVGVGPDALGLAYPRYRRQRSIDQLPVNADEAHNILIDRMATAGIPALLAYVWLLVAVGRAAWRARSRIPVEHRWLLGAFGGAFAGYFLQGQVSIDVVPLVLLGWVSLGALVSLSEPTVAAQRERLELVVLRPLPLGGFLLPLVVLVVAGSYLIRPFMADARYRDGLERSRSREALAAGAEDFRAATDWFGAEARYHARFADQLVGMATKEAASPALQTTLLDEAITGYDQALDRAPGDVQMERAKARAYVLLADADVADRDAHLASAASIYRELAGTVRRDASVHDDFGLVLEVQGNETDGGRAERLRHEARDQFTAALHVQARDTTALTALARIARTDGDLERARALLARARRYRPGDQGIRTALEQVERELAAQP